MKLVPYDYKKLGKVHGYSTKNVELIEEFESSGLDCVEIVGYRHKDARSCYHSMVNSIKRSRIGGIKCILRNGRVFLIKFPDLDSLFKD